MKSTSTSNKYINSMRKYKIIIKICLRFKILFLFLLSNNSPGQVWYQCYSSYKAPLLPCGGELTPTLQEARGAAAVRAGSPAPALERNHC